jgi:beta-N-acetylhexosaminidase
VLSRRSFLAAGIGMLTGVLAACATAGRSIVPGLSPTPSGSPVPAPTTPGPSAPTPAASPTEPSLREKIGQMVVIGFRGLTAHEADATLRQIADDGIGGVVLFSVDQLTGGARNVESPEQLRALVGSLSAAATAAPLLVSIDQEGGRVGRLTPAHGFPQPAPSAAELGRLDDPAVTRTDARAMAEMLAAAGITLNLAPVVDLAINPDNPIIAALGRSFGADPTLVTEHAAAFIEGHHEVGVLCALKHFPGHGSSTGDTHLGVVDVTDTWSPTELEPFAGLIDRGLADAILTAHVFNATVDPDHPATLSRPTIGGLLRDRLGFDGAVLSDDLQMGAIRDAYGYPEAVALAVEAGIDLLLIANQLVYEPDIGPRTVAIVEDLVRSGRISEARIDESWRRIARLKGVGWRGW